MEPSHDNIDLFDKLTEDQRTQVIEFTSITNTEDINTAIVYMQQTGFNMNVNIKSIFLSLSFAHYTKPSLNNDK